MLRSREARDAAMDRGCDTVDVQVQHGTGAMLINGRTDEMHWLSDTKLVNCLVTWSASPTNRILRRGQGGREGRHKEVHNEGANISKLRSPASCPSQPSPVRQKRLHCPLEGIPTTHYLTCIFWFLTVIRQMSFKLALPPTQVCVEYSY